MKKRDLREKAADLLKNDLAPGEEQEIIKELGNEGITPEEIESLKEMSSGIENAFDHNPSGRMDDMFYSMLKSETRKEEQGELNSIPALRNKYTLMLVAAGITLFILGWFSASMFKASSYNSDELAGLSGEIKDLRETLVLTMLDQASASERIKAVNMIKELDSSNERIIENLFKALNTDENDNVRLLALEALIKYTGNNEVRHQLVSSISKQTSPMIQLRMTEIMTTLNEKSSVPEFRRLLEDSNLNYSVRTRIQDAVVTLL
ncbi:MAG: HEAT repeat domain-containing protein [Chloroflexota bacterium]